MKRLPFILAIIFASDCMCQQFHDSVTTDGDGNEYPIKVLRDGYLWTTTNLKLQIPGSYCFDDKKENCQQFGRLYTYEAAKEGCKSLGEGWRLPTISEWQQLAKAYAPGLKDSLEQKKKAYRVLLAGGSSSFDAVLGGGRDQSGNYARIDAHGFYWTITESTPSTACFANFAKGSKALFSQYDGEKERAFSVRCVKNNGKK